MLDWELSDGRLWVENENTGEMVDFCEAIRVKGVDIDILSGEHNISIGIEITPGEETILPLSRGELTKKIMPKLLAYGLSCRTDDKSAEFILDILWDTMEDAEVTYFHKTLGFCEIDGNKVFLADSPIGKVCVEKQESCYVFREKTAKVGSYLGWRRIVRKYVRGSSELELALALGALAPVAHILREAGAIEEVPVVAFIGKSTTGKSTALKLIASLYGRPQITEGIISNLNITQNALFAKLEGLRGFPVLLDETTHSPALDFASLVYNLPEGVAKIRCESSGEVKKEQKFSGAIFFTGERSILEKTAKTEGLFVRVLELQCAWTHSKEQAEHLTAGLKKNYGCAVYPLMRWLLECDTEWLVSQYKDTLDFVRKYINVAETPLVTRLAKIYAQILLCGHVVQEALKIPLNLQGILELLRKHAEEFATSVATPEDWYECIKGHVAENIKHFPCGDEQFTSAEVWGVRKHHQYKSAVYIMVKKFKCLAEKLTGHSEGEVKKALAKAGWLYQDKSRHYTVKTDISGIKVDCVVVYLSDEVKKKPMKSKLKSSQMDFLLSEDED